MKPRFALLAAAAMALTPQLPQTAWGYECPTHFAETSAAISRVAAKPDVAEGRLSKDALSLADAHLHIARMTLIEAKYHHTQNGARHHARAIVRAKEALGYVAAAGSVYRNALGG